MEKGSEGSAGKCLYLEDLYIGQVFKSGAHALDEEQIMTFAAQFDPQPFHLSDEAARSTLFERLAASGWHTAAVTMRLLVTGGLPFPIIGTGGEIAWPRPTRPEDILQVVAEITGIKPSQSRPDRGMVSVRCETLNQHGEVVQTLLTKLVVHRRPD